MLCVSNRELRNMRRSLWICDRLKLSISCRRYRRGAVLPKIRDIKTIKDYSIIVTFEDGKTVLYYLEEDIRTSDDFKCLTAICGLFQQVKIDESITCIYWNDRIDLPSDTLLECGKVIPEEKIKELLAG